jgi:hypothetical protein
MHRRRDSDRNVPWAGTGVDWQGLEGGSRTVECASEVCQWEMLGGRSSVRALRLGGSNLSNQLTCFGNLLLESKSFRCVGASPSGKAAGFGPAIPRFES